MRHTPEQKHCSSHHNSDNLFIINNASRRRFRQYTPFKCKSIYIYVSLTISFFHLDLSLFLVYTNHNLQIRGTIIFVVRMYLC